MHEAAGERPRGLSWAGRGPAPAAARSCLSRTHCLPSHLHTPTHHHHPPPRCRTTCRPSWASSTLLCTSAASHPSRASHTPPTRRALPARLPSPPALPATRRWLQSWPRLFTLLSAVPRTCLPPVLQVEAFTWCLAQSPCPFPMGAPFLLVVHDCCKLAETDELVWLKAAAAKERCAALPGLGLEAGGLSCSWSWRRPPGLPGQGTSTWTAWGACLPPTPVALCTQTQPHTGPHLPPCAGRHLSAEGCTRMRVACLEFLVALVGLPDFKAEGAPEEVVVRGRLLLGFGCWLLLALLPPRSSAAGPALLDPGFRAGPPLRRLAPAPLLTACLPSPPPACLPLQKAREAVTSAFFKTIMLPSPAIHSVAARGLKLLNSTLPVPKALIQASLTPVLNQLRITKALSVPFLQVRPWGPWVESWGLVWGPDRGRSRAFRPPGAQCVARDPPAPSLPPVLQGVSRLLELLFEWFNVTLGEMLVAHLRKALEPEGAGGLGTGRPGARTHACLSACLSACLHMQHVRAGVSRLPFLKPAFLSRAQRTRCRSRRASCRCSTCCPPGPPSFWRPPATSSPAWCAACQRLPC